MESKIMLADVLNSIKQLVTNYAYSLNEASSKNIYNEYLKEFESLSILAKKLYNLSYELGWTSLTDANPKDIKKELKKENNILNNDN